MQNAVLELYVKPNSRKFGIISCNAAKKLLKIKVKSKAMKGKANAEIIKEFKRMFNWNIMIVKGEKSNRKIISISGMSERELILQLEKF